MLVSTLRRRIFGTLATSTLLATACGGQTAPTSSSGTATTGGGSSTDNSSSGSSGTEPPRSGTSSSGTPATCDHGRKERSCFTADSIITKNSGYGGRAPLPDAAPPPPPTRDSNGCVVLEEVMNGCCNPAISGPIVEGGKCCYEFCEGACCGRPLVVDGIARMARAVPRSDWADGGRSTSLPVLDAQTRAALRDDWTRDALLEHASIASFAAFTLELLAVGAPPDFVRDAQAATADEIEHARRTFSIASSFATGPVGPGPLAIGGVVPETDLAQIAAACVRDGCVNETLASAVAGAQAANACEPEIRATLERIAEDEARHAELAWRFVQWALATNRDDVREAVLAAFDAAGPTSITLPEGIDGTQWRAHGRLLPSEHAEIVRSVLDEVVRPCRDLLVRGVSPARATDARAVS